MDLLFMVLTLSPGLQTCSVHLPENSQGGIPQDYPP